jgi:hypothetical protein
MCYPEIGLEIHTMKTLTSLVILLLTFVLSPAHAESIVFNFNSLAPGATSNQIQTYMDGVLSAAGCTGCTVSVTGAVADQLYTGEGYVVGPNGTSLTLGDSESATNNGVTPNTSHDTFIANTNDSSAQVADQITMSFNFSVIGASFDYEIFPDGTCSQLNATNCGGAKVGKYFPNQPDFTFATSNNSNVFTQYGVTPSAGGVNGSSTLGPNGTILAPQWIGTYSGTFTPTTQLNFVDWPATIGIDNLTVTNASPEPSTMILILVGVVACMLAKKSRKHLLSLIVILFVVAMPIMATQIAQVTEQGDQPNAYTLSDSIAPHCPSATNPCETFIVNNLLVYFSFNTSLGVSSVPDNESALLTLFASSSTPGGLFGNTTAIQSGFSGTFSLIDDSGGIEQGKNLLSGTFANHATVLGTLGGYGLSFYDSDTTTSPNEIAFNSNFVSFSGGEAVSFALTNLSAPLTIDSNNFLGNNTGSGVSTFSANVTPEPFSMILVGFGLLICGIARMARRTPQVTRKFN